MNPLHNLRPSSLRPTGVGVPVGICTQWLTQPCNIRAVSLITITLHLSRRVPSSVRLSCVCSPSSTSARGTISTATPTSSPRRRPASRYSCGSRWSLPGRASPQPWESEIQINLNVADYFSFLIIPHLFSGLSKILCDCIFDKLLKLLWAVS